MNLAPSIPGFGARRDEGAESTRRPAVNRTPVKSRAGAVRRERHQADYMILVVVVALTALGILMVYSSSAMKGYLSQDADTFATVGPQIQWALLGLVAMAVMMRVDYRWLRVASVPFYVLAIVLLVLVFVPQLNIVVGGSARWLKLGPLPAIHPAEIEGSSKANALSMRTMKTSWVEFSWPSSCSTGSTSSNRKSEISGSMAWRWTKPPSELLRLPLRTARCTPRSY